MWCHERRRDPSTPAGDTVTSPPRLGNLSEQTGEVQANVIIQASRHTSRRHRPASLPPAGAAARSRQQSCDRAPPRMLMRCALARPARGGQVDAPRGQADQRGARRPLGAAQLRGDPPRPGDHAHAAGHLQWADHRLRVKGRSLAACACAPLQSVRGAAMLVHRGYGHRHNCSNSGFAAR
jgi:hypothetical protein